MTLRYDPRDLGEIRGFHRHRFLCQAIHPEYAGQTVTLKDIQTARAQHRRSLRRPIHERITRVADFLPGQAQDVTPPAQAAPPTRQPSLKLRTYFED